MRPNSGRIDPGQTVEVQSMYNVSRKGTEKTPAYIKPAVLLQAMKEDPPPDAKCRDKFLVQSVLVTADKEFTNVGQLVRGHTRIISYGTN